MFAPWTCRGRALPPLMPKWVHPQTHRSSRDTLLPAWEEKFLDVEKSLKLRIEDKETLMLSMKETFGDVAFLALFPADIESLPNA